MNYGKINRVDTANGTGCRVSLFVSGCRNACPGCFNEEAWDFQYGKPFTMLTVNEIMDALRPEWIDGLTVLGGDPFEPENLLHVENLCMMVKDRFPHKTIWIYTGYFWEGLKDINIMNYIDVLVDGPFAEDLKDLTLAFRGSRNQRIIDVQQSLRKKEVVLYDL